MKTTLTLFVTAALAVAACAHAGTAAASPQAPVLTQGFDDVGSLPGWLSVNQSEPQGQSWFQGNSGIFAAQAGAPDSYIAANFLSVANGNGSIDNWLITPELTLSGPTQLTFYTRSAGTPGFADTLEVRFGSGTSADTATFAQTLLTIGVGSAYPDTWQEYSVIVSGSGRFAFRYTGTGAMNEYIGIDSVSVSAAAVPEPSSWLMFGAGLGLLGFLRRRARRIAGAGLALAALGLSQGAAAQQDGTAAAAPQQEGMAQQQEGMVVVRDPVTGEFRAPTAAEFQALRGAAGKGASTQGLSVPRITQRADGTRQGYLGPNATVYEVVTRDAQGQLHEECVSGQAGVDAAVNHNGASAAPAKE